MKHRINYWNIAASLMLLAFFSFGCTDSGSQQPADENTTDSQALQPNTGGTPVEADSARPGTATEDAQVVPEEVEESTTAKVTKPPISNNQTGGRNLTQPKKGSKNTNPETAPSNAGKTTVPAEEKPEPSPATKPKPEPDVTPVETPPENPTPPVQPIPNPVEKPASPAKPEVPKPEVPKPAPPAPPASTVPDSNWPVPAKD